MALTKQDYTRFVIYIIALAFAAGGVALAVRSQGKLSAGNSVKIGDGEHRLTVLETRYESDITHLRDDMTDQRADMKDLKKDSAEQSKLLLEIKAGMK